MILDRNMFVERVLPGSVLRKLTEAEMAEYRRPYLEREDRWPTLTWPRQIPIAGEPADVVQIVGRLFAEWMAASDIPKLFVNAEPGAILIGAAHGIFAEAGRTRLKSPFRARISSRKIPERLSAGRWPTG